MRRIVIAVLMSLMLFGTAIAQQVTVLNRVNRQGTHMSATVAIPAIADPNQDIVIRALMTTAAIENPAYSFTLRIYYYSEADALWYQHGAMTWQGAPWVSTRPKEPPKIAVPLGGLVGKTVRVELDIPTLMSIGATAEIQ